MMIFNKDIEYVNNVLSGKINAPLYVRKQCAVYKHIFDDADEKYCISAKKRSLIIEITKLLIMPRGFSAGKTVFETLSGFHQRLSAARRTMMSISLR